MLPGTEISVSSHSFSWGKYFETDKMINFLFQSHIIMFFFFFFFFFFATTFKFEGEDRTKYYLEKEDDQKQYNSLLDRCEK